MENRVRTRKLMKKSLTSCYRIDKKEYVDISGLEPSDIVMVTELIQHLRTKNQTINKAQK
jgi:hypothetical protein